VYSTIKKISSLIKNKKLFVFDFDGVIADSNNIKTEAFKEMFKAHGENVTKKVIDHHRNNASIDRFQKFKFYYNNYLDQEISDEEASVLGKKFSNIILNKIINCPEIEGSTIFLEKLHNLGKLSAINSATPQEEINLIIKERNLSKFFGKVNGSPSSKKEILLSLMTEYKLKNKDLVFFGDDKNDKLAADSLNILFIGVGKKLNKKFIDNKLPSYFIENFVDLNL